MLIKKKDANPLDKKEVDKIIRPHMEPINNTLIKTKK